MSSPGPNPNRQNSRIRYSQHDLHDDDDDFGVMATNLDVRYDEMEEKRRRDDEITNEDEEEEEDDHRKKGGEDRKKNTNKWYYALKTQSCIYNYFTRRF